MARTLGTRAVEQLQADHAWVKQQRRGPASRRDKWGDDRQPLIEVCLTDDLSPTLPATGWLMRRDEVFGIYSTSTKVQVYGDDVLHAGSDPPVLSGQRVICAWLLGRWTAIRRSGSCQSSSSSSSSSLSSSSSSLSYSSSGSSESVSSSSSSSSSLSSSAPSTPSSSSSSSLSSQPSSSSVSSISSSVISSSLSSPSSSQSSQPSAPSSPSSSVSSDSSVSSGSSQSSQPSSPASSSSSNCVEVLKDISLNTDTCQLTKVFVEVVRC